MKEKPLISIILPVYNIESFLPKCMDSLFVQTYKNLEFVIVDDGSQKECADLCDSYQEKDSRITVYHKENGGLSDARNYGIQRAKGEYITCVDPDDYVDCDYVEYLYRLICKYHTEMSICQHRVIYVGGKTKEFGKSGDEVLDVKTCIRRMLYHDVIDTSAWAKLYRRSLFTDVEYPKGKVFEDIATTYKLMIASGQIAVGYESKYNYIIRPDSIVNSDFRTQKLDLLEMTDRMSQDVLDRYPDLEKAVRRRQVYARFSTLNQMLDTDEKEYKDEMVSYIRKYSKEILRDRNIPKRDRAAFLSLSFGLPVYKLIWKIYQRYSIGGDI